MRSHVGGEENETFFIRMWKLHFKTVRLMAISNRPKQIIFVSGGLELLRMVSEPVRARQWAVCDVGL